MLVWLANAGQMMQKEAIVLPDPQDFLQNTSKPALLTRVRKQLFSHLQSIFMLAVTGYSSPLSEVSQKRQTNRLSLAKAVSSGAGRKVLLLLGAVGHH